MDREKDEKSSLIFRAGSLLVALGFLGFLMLRAENGCSKASTQAKPEAPAPAVASGALRSSSAPPSEESVLGNPPPSARPGSTPAPASSQPKPFFPATKAAPLPWAHEQAPNPPPQQQAPNR